MKVAFQQKIFSIYIIWANMESQYWILGHDS